MPHPEGVIQFRLDHSDQALERHEVAGAFSELVAWREILTGAGLVGRDPRRYEGWGFGNLSVRIGGAGTEPGRRSFLVTGTGTSGKTPLTLADCALVERWDTASNQVTSSGHALPSSEALSHSAVYDCAADAGAVIHVHAPALWRRARDLRLPVTDPCATNGTPAMAEAVADAYAAGSFADRRILAMGGHLDGILTYGRSLEEAGLSLLRWFARALAQTAG